MERPRLEADADVARYVGGADFDSSTGQISGSAFDRKAKDVDGLSFTRTGFFAKAQSEDDDAIRQIMASRLKLGATACFAELNSGDANATLADFEVDFWFCEDPLESDGDRLANPAHALLIGLPFAGEAVGSLKSEVAGDRLCRTIKRTFPARLG